ncbi:putative secologanin synthase [Helianthus annuus]|nr:putative secologanin synthase [Helianthus annuus]
MLNHFVLKFRFIPTQANKKFKENVKELRHVLMGIINKRKKAIDMGEGKQDDLLGILLASNTKEIEEHGVGMSMEDVIEECKLFYIAGSETTSNLIVWTMVCLSLHQEWQIRAREEIVQAFGNNQPDFEGLKNLKILTMILNEVLRLYPPVIMMTRATHKDTKLGNMMIPSGVQLTLAMVHLHHDREIWGHDVNEFNPERFAEGIVNATKGKGSSPFFPFSNGPRVCIGQNLAMTEAKTAMALILQRFSFELSPSYKHSPFPVFTLPPQFGAHLILRNIS